MKKPIIKTGNKFNKLTAIKFSFKNKRSQQFWLFKCECGEEKVIQVNAVKSGQTKSCGCLGKIKNWKGGKKKNSKGYIEIYKPEHPFARNKYILHSRLVTEKCLSRYLTEIEVIHHINGIKDDDRPENLYLFPCNADHMRHHGYRIKEELKSNIFCV